MIRKNLEILNFIEQQFLKDYPKQVMQKTIRAGDCFIGQDSTIHHLYAIKKGIAKCYIREENGKDYILEFLGEGEILGEMELIRNAPCLCNVEALTDLELYKMNGHFFTDLLERNKDFNKLLMIELVDRLSHTAARASYQQIYPLEYAVLKLASLYVHQQLSLSKHDLADYLGISVRSLNRALKKLREQNIIAGKEFNLNISKNEIEKLLRQFDEE